jgi:hypothetical protein
MSTGPPAQDYFVRTSKFFSFYLDIHVYIYIYYTLRFYFPYLSLLAQPVTITLYGQGLDCLVFYNQVVVTYIIFHDLVI